MKPLRIEYVRGDLFQTDCRVLAHGVNCQGVMGSGVAAQIKQRYPEVFAAYKSLCADESVPSLIGVSQLVKTRCGKAIYNCFTQINYGRTGHKYVSYDALDSCLKNIANDKLDNLIAIPKIGAGLGGGNWGIIERIIEENLIKNGISVKVYEL